MGEQRGGAQKKEEKAQIMDQRSRDNLLAKAIADRDEKSNSN